MDWDPLHRWNSSAERRHPRKATPLSSHLASHLLLGRRAADVYGGPIILNAQSQSPILIDPPNRRNASEVAVASRPKRDCRDWQLSGVPNRPAPKEVQMLL
jgi:hypothetical protein